MATIWFTSDSHFFHENFLTFTDKEGLPVRPFSSVEEVDELMVARWNEVVRPQDHIYHLGDVTMERGSAKSSQAQRLIRWMGRLNGHKRLVLGNHDHFPVQVYVEAGFEKIRGVWKGFEGFTLTHVPIHPDSIGWRSHVNVHGHIHERLVRLPDSRPDPRYINICVEQTNYRPISLDELRKKAGYDG